LQLLLSTARYNSQAHEPPHEVQALGRCDYEKDSQGFPIDPSSPPPWRRGIKSVPPGAITVACLFPRSRHITMDVCQASSLVPRPVHTHSRRLLYPLFESESVAVTQTFPALSLAARMCMGACGSSRAKVHVAASKYAVKDAPTPPLAGAGQQKAAPAAADHRKPPVAGGEGVLGFKVTDLSVVSASIWRYCPRLSWSPGPPSPTRQYYYCSPCCCFTPTSHHCMDLVTRTLRNFSRWTNISVSMKSPHSDRVHRCMSAARYLSDTVLILLFERMIAQKSPMVFPG
jgi:hypothetical protein